MNAKPFVKKYGVVKSVVVTISKENEGKYRKNLDIIDASFLHMKDPQKYEEILADHLRVHFFNSSFLVTYRQKNRVGRSGKNKKKCQNKKNSKR